MTRPAPVLRLAAVALLVLLVAAACSNGDDVAARVNGRAISDAQVSDAAELYRFLSGLNQAPCGGEPVPGEPPEAPCNRFALGVLIQERIIGDYASEHGLSVSGSRIEDAVSQVAGVAGGEEALREGLRAEGLSLGELRELAGRLLLFDEVQRDLAESELTDATLRERYRAEEQRYTQLHTQHILLATEREAQQIAQRATAGNFTRLARRFSTDTSVGDNGGDLGFLPAANLDPGYVAGALALEPGAISEPVQSQFGWHVIRLIAKRLAPFAQVRDELRQQLSAEAFEDWVRRSWADGDIEVNPRYGRFDAQTGQVVSVTTNATGSPEPPEGAGPTP